MKKSGVFIIIALLSVSVFAESRTMFIPLGGYSGTFRESVSENVLNGGLMVNHSDDLGSSNADGYTLMGQYTMSQMENSLFDEAYTFHSISFTGDFRFGENRLFGIAGISGENLSSSLKGASFIAGYTRALSISQLTSLKLGGALFVANVTIGNVTLPVIPIPVLSFTYQSKDYMFSADFTGGVSLSFSLFNTHALRISGSLSPAGFSSIRDIHGNLTLKYYPLLSHPLWKIMNLSAGIENQSKSYSLKNGDRYAVQDFSVFAGINVAALTFKAGCNINGIQTVNSEKAVDGGRGYYLQLSGMWLF